MTTLRELLDNADDEDLLVAACVALRKINDPRAFDPLLALLKPETPSAAVVQAIRGLTRTADVRAIPALVRMWFTESRAPVESELERAFAALCGPVEEKAREKLESSEEKERLAAVRAAISEPRLVRALLGIVLDASDEAAASAAIEVLQKQGHELEGLARTTLLLPDKTAEVRLLAIALYASLQPEDAVEHLEGLLCDDDEPPEVRRHSVFALKRLGSEAALDALRAQEEHDDESVQGWVKEALA